MAPKGHPNVTWWHLVALDGTKVSPLVTPMSPWWPLMSPQCHPSVTWWHLTSPQCHLGGTEWHPKDTPMSHGGSMSPRCPPGSLRVPECHPRSPAGALPSITPAQPISARFSPLSLPTPSPRCACAVIAAVVPRGEWTNQRRAGGRGIASLPARRRSGGAKMFYHVSGTGRGGGAGGGAPEGARGAPEVVQGGGKGGSWDLQWGGGAD